mmetsp:Transcript_40342/g.67014  ORF Transcript_40342/g.67014 Transcript_40342/m.67014 type:complete len:762 (-) Transcript_40342:271-2556(-)
MPRPIALSSPLTPRQSATGAKGATYSLLEKHQSASDSITDDIDDDSDQEPEFLPPPYTGKKPGYTYRDEGHHPGYYQDEPDSPPVVKKGKECYYAYLLHEYVKLPIRQGKYTASVSSLRNKDVYPHLKNAATQNDQVRAETTLAKIRRVAALRLATFGLLLLLSCPPIFAMLTRPLKIQYELRPNKTITLECDKMSLSAKMVESMSSAIAGGDLAAAKAVSAYEQALHEAGAEFPKHTAREGGPRLLDVSHYMAETDVVRLRIDSGKGDRSLYVYLFDANIYMDMSWVRAFTFSIVNPKLGRITARASNPLCGVLYVLEGAGTRPANEVDLPYVCDKFSEANSTALKAVAAILLHANSGKGVTGVACDGGFTPLKCDASGCRLSHEVRNKSSTLAIFFAIVGFAISFTVMIFAFKTGRYVIAKALMLFVFEQGPEFLMTLVAPAFFKTAQQPPHKEVRARLRQVVSHTHPAYIVDELVSDGVVCGLKYNVGLLSALVHSLCFVFLPMMCSSVLIGQIGCVPPDDFFGEITSNTECRLVGQLYAWPLAFVSLLAMSLSLVYMGSWYFVSKKTPDTIRVFQWIEPLFTYSWGLWVFLLGAVLIQAILWLILEMLLFPTEYLAFFCLIMTPIIYVIVVSQAFKRSGLKKSFTTSFKKLAQEAISTILFGLVMILLIVLWTISGLWFFDLSSSGFGGFAPAITGVIGAVTGAINTSNKLKKQASGLGKNVFNVVEKVHVEGVQALENVGSLKSSFQGQLSMKEIV